MIQGKEEKSTIEKTNGRPLVTFALFSYNQEKFIREAMEGAFVQTYEPLEIIMSDDASTDRTFSIMDQMVRDYRGPHSVRAIRQPVNEGTFNHVLSVVEQSKGNLIVLAAGDDVSHGNRVEEITKTWQNSDAWGLYSRFDCMDERSCITERGVVSFMKRNDLRNYFQQGENIQLIHGATSAYDRRAFTGLTKSTSKILNEDAVMSVLLNSIGKKIIFVSKDLVSYRNHPDSTTNANIDRKSVEAIVKTENRAVFYERHHRNLNEYLLVRLNELQKSNKLLGSMVRIEKIYQQLSIYETRANWYDMSLFEKLGAILSKKTKQSTKWMLPRLFGMPFFARLKWLIFGLNSFWCLCIRLTTRS